MSNKLTRFALAGDLHCLGSLVLNDKLMSVLSLPPCLNLCCLELGGNQLTNVSLPDQMPSLTHLDISRNLLEEIFLPPGLGNLTYLDLSYNALTDINLPAGLDNLQTLRLRHPITREWHLPIPILRRQIRLFIGWCSR